MSKNYLQSPAVYEAIKDYTQLHRDSSLKPVQFADQREKILGNFIQAVAEANDRSFQSQRIDANGEFRLFLDTENGPNNYGDELAELISSQPRRTGFQETDAKILPENNWCMMNHFNVEKLLCQVRDEMGQNRHQKFDSDTPSP